MIAFWIIRWDGPEGRNDMANCDSLVAKQGWLIYKASMPAPSLEELNRVLARAGVGPISNRTYRHYRRMKLHGVEDYLPINELDVRLKLRRTA
jgi:hypothetical protein